MNTSDTITYALTIDTATGKASIQALSAEAKNLQGNLDKAKGAAAGAGAATQGMGMQATQAKGAIAALGAGISMLNPQAAQLVMVAGNVSGALGGVSKMAGILGAAAGPIGLMVVAIGSAVVIWKKLADGIKEAEERMKDATTTADKTRASWGSDEAARVQEAFKSGKISREDAISRLATSGALANPKLLEQEQRAQTTYDAAQSARPGVMVRQADGTFSSPERDAGIAAAGTALQGAKENVKRSAELAATAVIDALGEAIAKEAEGTDAFKNGAKLAAMNASGELTAASAAWLGSARGADAFGAGIGANTSMPGFGGFTAGGFSTMGGFGTPFSLATAGTTIPEAGPTGASVADASRMAQWLSRGTGMGAVGIDKALGGVGMGVGTVSQLASGNALGALSALGPVGMAASGIAGGLSAIGKAGASGIKDQLSGLKDSIIEALRALPEILTEVLPEFVGSLVSELIPALAAALPDIIWAGVVRLPIEIFKALWEAIKEILPNKTPGGGGFLGIGDKNSGFLGIGNERGVGEGGMHGFLGINGQKGLGKFLGSFDEGSGGKALGQDGWGFLHRDDVIFTTEQLAKGAASKQPQQTATIDLRGATFGQDWDRDLEGRLSRMFGPGGLGMTTAFAGGLRSG